MAELWTIYVNNSSFSHGWLWSHRLTRHCTDPNIYYGPLLAAVEMTKLEIEFVF